MPKFEDLTGQRFGRLVVIVREPNKTLSSGKKKTMWKCACDCGQEAVVRAECLKSGYTKSCGCLSNEMFHKMITKHGHCKERLYSIWQAIRQRCLNPNDAEYKSYGGRGISVCDEWSDYLAFRSWAYSSGYDENAPYRACTIDRIDNDGNYEPSNCRWVNMDAQMRNKSNHRNITYKGVTKPLVVWAEDLGLSASLLDNRIRRGWSIEETLTIPKLPNNKYGKSYRKERHKLNG